MGGGSLKDNLFHKASLHNTAAFNQEQSILGAIAKLVTLIKLGSQYTFGLSLLARNFVQIDYEMR